MFDLGWSELLVIGIVALIVVGPKDLPGMFRTLGRFTAKIKSMAREFQRAMDDAAQESGVGDVAKTFKDATNPKQMGLDKLKEAATEFEKWQPKSPITPPKPAMDEDRAEAARKINEAAAKTAQARQDAEAAAKAEADATAAAAPAAKKDDA